MADEAKIHRNFPGFGLSNTMSTETWNRKFGVLAVEGMRSRATLGFP